MTTIIASFAPATWSRWPRPLAYRQPAYFAPAFRAAVIGRAFDAVAELVTHPTGVFMPFVIGKPSHDKLAHPGTRVEARRSYGPFASDKTHSIWHCPCDQQCTSIKALHAHVQRIKGTANNPICPLTAAKLAAAATAKRAALFASMSDEQLAAYIAERRA